MNQGSDLMGKRTLSKNNSLDIMARLVIGTIMIVFAGFSLFFVFLPFNESVDIVILSILSGLLLLSLLVVYCAWRELRERPLSDKEMTVGIVILIIYYILVLGPLISILIW
ncbi:MAG: hypothetical protein ACXADU_20520 [Promethearchaeota archaeon]|jgi:hypothetical protein